MDWVPVEILFLGFAAPFERNLNRLAPQKAGEFSEIATGMAFTGTTAKPEFQLQLDPRSCFVTGYELAPAH